MTYVINYVRRGKDGRVLTREKIMKGTWPTIVAIAHENILDGEKDER
jgi:hypothetical protein